MAVKETRFCDKCYDEEASETVIPSEFHECCRKMGRDLCPACFEEEFAAYFERLESICRSQNRDVYELSKRLSEVQSECDAKINEANERAGKFSDMLNRKLKQESVDKKAKEALNS